MQLAVDASDPCNTAEVAATMDDFLYAGLKSVYDNIIEVRLVIAGNGSRRQLEAAVVTVVLYGDFLFSNNTTPARTGVVDPKFRSILCA